MFDSCLTFFGKCIVNLCYVAIIILAITFTPGLPPEMNFEAYTLSPSILEGPLTTSAKLNGAEQLFKNEVKGPEDFAVYKNELYMSCHGGAINKLSHGKLIPVVKTGKPCDGFYQEHICGRPLGLRFDKSGMLYIADAYNGLLKANVTSGETQILVSMDQAIEGNRPMLPNSIVISKNNEIIYWTDSSTTHHLYDGLFTFLGNGNGRVIKHIIKENKNEVLLKNLHFANGILLSKDESFLIIAESFKARLLRYYLQGPKAGSFDVFIDNLPGFPDNLATFDSKNFVVSLIMPVDNLGIFLSSAPLVRKFLARSLTLIESAFSIVNYFCPNMMTEKIIHMIGHFEMLKSLRPDTQTISLVLDYKGAIIDVLQSNDKTVSSISALINFDNNYYLGSPFNAYLGRVKRV